MKPMFFVIVLFLFMVVFSVAADFKEGVIAYRSGDYTTASREWLLLAAEGDAIAQYNLALLYEYGDGLPQDDAEAVKWYTLAAEQGVAWAQSNLGVKYASGDGVQEDDVEAVKWYKLAAEQGDVQAHYNLGIMYVSGDGVKKDLALAFKQFSHAAKLGNIMAQFNLGQMYANGYGMAKNKVLAYMWWDVSSSKGFEKAFRYKELIKKTMTSSQIVQAEFISQKCRNSKNRDCKLLLP